ncbi:hypothetical protein B296_00006635 [Ensete ventricosum]|uniref:Uncharacterized protein n=1 Tax=Ensete ventricosum TaxID=4639 RepID=A0A427AMX1_ENSVE|nr:hypothetical protein B296_00006635 [Ensete ventricosum]
MRFTDSPVVELPAGGAVLTFEQDNGSMHVVTSVCPCSLIRLKFVERWLSRPPAAVPNPYAHLLRSQASAPALRPPFDLVIVADVVYMEDSVARLVTALEALVWGDGAVLLGYQLRSPDAHQVFWELCRQAFPVTEKVPHEDLHPDYAYEETDGYILRKQK